MTKFIIIKNNRDNKLNYNSYSEFLDIKNLPSEIKIVINEITELLEKDDTIYKTDKFLDMVVISRIDIINKYDLLINNKYKNITINNNHKYFTFIINICKRYNIDLLNIINTINSIHTNKITLKITLSDHDNIENNLNELTDIYDDINQCVFLNYIEKSDNYTNYIINDILNKMVNNSFVYYKYTYSFKKLLPNLILQEISDNADIDNLMKIKKSFEHFFKKIPNSLNVLNYVIKKDFYEDLFNRSESKRYLSMFKFCINNSKNFKIDIYNFNRLNTLNQYILNSEIFNNKILDLVKVCLTTPKLLFSNNLYLSYYEYFSSNDCEKYKELENILYLAFYILYCSLNYHCSNNITDININSPFIHKLSTINSIFLNNRYNFKIPIYKLIKPITKGWIVKIENITNNIYSLEHIEDNKFKFINDYNLNDYLSSYNRLKIYTLGIFQPENYDFNYYTNYKTNLYNKFIPRVMLTGSMIGCYCLSKQTNMDKFIHSDIDISVIDGYIAYQVKENILDNIKKMNENNKKNYKIKIIKILLKYQLSIFIILKIFRVSINKTKRCRLYNKNK